MSAKCPICHNEYFIVKDIVCTGLGKQGYPFGKKAYIPKCSKCGYQLDPCFSEEETLLRISRFATDILVSSLVMHKNLNKVTMFLLKFRLYFATGFSAALYHSQFLPISIYSSLSSAPTIAEAGELLFTLCQ